MSIRQSNISLQDLGSSPKLEGRKEVVNLFSAHDFDVKIDIDVGSAGNQTRHARISLFYL